MHRTTRRRTAAWSVGLLLVVLAAAGRHVAPLVSIATAYEAKQVCSGVFVSGRNADDVLASSRSTT
jgi:hypothetical protein